MKDPFLSVVRQPNLSDQVAEQMQELIVQGRLRPGERLPSERELADRFGVSRTVIREAVRSLMAKGLLEVHSGSGIIVCTPTASSIADHFNLLLRLNSEGDPLEYIFDVRHVLEVEIAGRAARQATKVDIEEMEYHLQQMADNLEDLEQAAAADVAFHAALARATQNPLFAILLDSISEIMLEVRRLGFTLSGAPQKILEEHARILQSVKSGDVEASQATMSEHLKAGQMLVREGVRRDREQQGRE
jgi:GntR family transcriptional regulator, transcriptional repressor for pyruvate dehydrogenase complex